MSVLIGLGRALFVSFKKALGKTDKILTISSIGVFTSMVLVAIFIDTFAASKIAILFWSITGLALSTNNKNDK